MGEPSPEVPGAAWRKANGTFLVSLLTGMATGVVFGVFFITHLLENYPIHLWAFFFTSSLLRQFILVLRSSAGPLRKSSPW
ncbi:MAG: DUF368 domain-containing protein [Lewinellaceae bacterium]|nr:DUF368 domain-containing protein [Lewinellaceae bacterium]